MRIFFICRRVPFPPDRGDKIATFNEIRHLSAQHEVHVFCLGDGARDLDNIAGLSEYAKSVTAVPVSGLTIKVRALKALIMGQPLSVAALDEAKLHGAIQRKFAELGPDLVIVYSCNVAQFAGHFPHVPRIMQFGDLDSLKWRRYAERSRIPLKWIYAIEGRRLLSYERLIAHSFSQALVHTEIERRDFQRLVPGVPVALVGNGVDLDYFRSAASAKRPSSIVFTGVMDYRPNVDAVVWFCNEVLPIVWAEIADANFTICGSRPVRAVRRLARLSGVPVGCRTPVHISIAPKYLLHLYASPAASRTSCSRGWRWGYPVSPRLPPGAGRRSPAEKASLRRMTPGNSPNMLFNCYGIPNGGPRWDAGRVPLRKRITAGRPKWRASIK